MDFFLPGILMNNNMVRQKKIKYKLKSECSDALKAPSQKTLTKQQSLLSVMGRGIKYDLLIFKELLTIQKWELNPVNNLITILMLIICCCASDH